MPDDAEMAGKYRPSCTNLGSGKRMGLDSIRPGPLAGISRAVDVKILCNFREASDWLSAVTLLFTLYLRSPECGAAAAGESANPFSPALAG